jgi:hypothetical protein
VPRSIVPLPLLLLLLLGVLATGCADGECTTCPTATLTANGKTELRVPAGELITYAWSSANADAASSSVEIRPSADACGNTDGPWVVRTLEGTTAPEPLLACQAGFSYTLSFTAVQTDSGDRATATVTIDVD